MKLDKDETLDGDNALYFKEPLELLELFNKLESENLSLIQACQQVNNELYEQIPDKILIFMKAEARLEEGRAISIKTRSELNQQAENLETEIRQLEERIYRERKWRRSLKTLVKKHILLSDNHQIENYICRVSGESRRGGEDKMLDYFF